MKFVAAILLALLSLRFYFYFTEAPVFKNGDRVRITATINSEPIRYETSLFLKLFGLKVYLPLYPGASYGDRVVVEGVVDGDKLKSVKLVSVEESRGKIHAFREKLIDFYRQSLPQKESALLTGLAIGSKSEIPQDFWSQLKNSGTAHVVVASGMNVTLIAGFLVGFFTIFLKRKKALVFVILGIWSYALLSGWDAPIIRASLMGTIAFAAQEFGRMNVTIRALLVSAFLMLLISPGYIEDVGFLLSFFATLGLILFESKVRARLKFFPEIVKQDLSTTLSAQIGVFPILFWTFGRFNLLSPVANVLVLWTIVPLTILGIAGGLIGLIVPLLGKWILYLALPLTWWFIRVVEVFG